MKRILLLILAIVALVIPFVACGESAASSAGTAVTPSDSTPTQAAKSFKVGQTVSIGGWTVVVNSVKTSTGNEFNQPKSGNVFLLVDVTVTNQTGQSQTVSSAGQFNLKDSTGQAYTESIDTAAPNPPDGALSNGSKLRGTLTYEVPKAQKSFDFGFQPDITSTDQATWTLTVK